MTEDDLEQFHDTFRGGEEERAEVLKYYQRFAGDMSKVGSEAWLAGCSWGDGRGFGGWWGATGCRQKGAGEKRIEEGVCSR